jgi:hypothetical protein
MPPNQSLQFTRERFRSQLRMLSGHDDQLEFMKHIVDPFDFAQDRSFAKAGFRQR